MKSKGLGDSIEKFTKATGIKKLVKAVAGEDCGCDKRKEILNNLFPYELTSSMKKESAHGEPYLECHDELEVPIAIFNKTDEPDVWSRKNSIMQMGIQGTDPEDPIARFGIPNGAAGPVGPSGPIGNLGPPPPYPPPPPACMDWYSGCTNSSCCQSFYSVYWFFVPCYCVNGTPPPPPPPPPTGFTVTTLPAAGNNVTMSWGDIATEMNEAHDQFSIGWAEYQMWNYGFNFPNMDSGSGNNASPTHASEFFEADW